MYADLAFKGLQLNIIRYNIGGGENPDIPNTMEHRARMPGFEPRAGLWNWNADANQRWFLRAAVARGADHVVAFANSPPHWMTASGSVTGAKDGSLNNLLTDFEDRFAVYLATVVSNLTVLDRVKFDSITPMNEPGGSWWKHGSRSEGTHMSHDQQARMVNLLRAELDRRGLKMGVVATEDNDEQSAIKSLNSYDSVTRSHLGQIVTHTYGGTIHPVWANSPAHLAKRSGSRNMVTRTPAE